MTHAGSPAADATGLPASRPAAAAGGRPRPGPLHVVLALVAALAVYATKRSVDDIDAYWHVPVGREILATHRLNGLGTAWLAVPAAPWRTSQWLSEVLMATAVDHGGWRALVLARLGLLVALLAVLAVTLLPRASAFVTVPVGSAVLLAVGGAVQDRPQSVSLVLLAVVAAWGVRLLDGGRRPPPVVVAVVCLVWAQLHGLWVLAPAAFALVAAGLWLDGRRGPDLRPALVTLAASLAGVLNPLGPGSFLLPLRLRSAASGTIAEWRTTALTGWFVAAWLALVVLLVAAWVAGRRRVPRSELLWCAAWTVFGLLAYRNVAVSALLLAPAVVVAADRAWGERLGRLGGPTGRREGRLLVAAAVALALAAPAVVAVQVLRTDPLVRAPALRIAQRLAASPQPVRVFNAYNASGTLVAFGGDRVRLAVDGRADLWGAPRLEAMTAAQDLRGDWERTVSGFRPEAFVLPADCALTTLLLREGRWRLDLRDGDYVLLLPAR